MKQLTSLLLIILLTNTFSPLSVATPRTAISHTQQEQTDAPLSNKDILEMIAIGLSTEIILAKIKTSTCNFDTSTAALRELKKAAVPDAIILAMVQTPTRRLEQPTVTTVSSPLPSDLALSGEAIVVPDGTPFTVVTTEEISSKTATEGDPITFKADEDVIVDNRTVISKGAIVKGTVADAEKSGRIGKGGKLSIRVESVVAVDGQRIKLRASKGREGGDSTGSVIALTLFLSPLFLLKRGSNAKIKAGTKINVYTDEEKRVRVASVASNLVAATQSLTPITQPVVQVEPVKQPVSSFPSVEMLSTWSYVKAVATDKDRITSSRVSGNIKFNDDGSTYSQDLQIPAGNSNITYKRAGRFFIRDNNLHLTYMENGALKEDVYSFVFSPELKTLSLELRRTNNSRSTWLLIVKGTEGVSRCTEQGKALFGDFVCN